MLGSRVCWQLLLGWALLLGQPVFGDSDAVEESSLQEPEELAPVTEEPEQLATVSPEDSVPESEESEERELEYQESKRRRWLREDLSRPWNFEMHQLKAVALLHHDRHSTDYYRPFEKANLRSEKAIGTMIYLQMILAKTNCTNDQPAKEEESDFSYYYRLYHADRYPRHCEPLSDSEEEKMDCMFTIFEDARDPGNPIVIDQHCSLFNEELGRRPYLPLDLIQRF